MRASAPVRGLMRSRTVDALPYGEPFGPRERVVIDTALREAAAALQHCKDIDLSTCSEVDVTDRLERILNEMLESEPSVVPGFSKAFFQTIVRGAEVCTHDFALLEKRPDITFRSQRKLPNLRFPQHCALFVECKIVDRNHAIGLYGTEGIRRFVAGLYAWAVPSAIMIAYTRHGRSMTRQLQGLLRREGVRYALVGSLQTISSSDGVSRGVTVHERSLPRLPKGAGGYITLHHHWFDLDSIPTH